MENSNNHIVNEELLTRYLLGEATPDECALVEHWLEAAPENKSSLRRIKTMLDMVNLSKMNVDDEWQSFKPKLKNKPLEVSLDVPQKKISVRYYAIAASLFVLIGLSVYFAFFFNTVPKEVVAESGEIVKEIKLADGTNISLNRNSVLQYPESFTGDKRLVKLNGEAFFEVAHDSAKPFVVETEQFTVTVLGTSFYVSAFEGKTQQVVVESGTVKCQNLSTGESIVLNAGEKYILGQPVNEPVPASQKDMNAYAWKTARLVFVDENMTAIAESIGQTYGCQIILKGPIKNCILTVNFEDLTLDGVLNVLQTILNIEIRKDSKNIEIKGDGC